MIIPDQQPKPPRLRQQSGGHDQPGEGVDGHEGYPPVAPDADLESVRLAQFRTDLAERAEWFRPSAALVLHINTLRQTPLTAVDFAA